MPCRLHEQANLRVKQLRLHRGDVEELGVEPVNVVDEPAPTSVRGTRRARVLFEVVAPIPAVGGDLGDQVVAVDQVPPELAKVTGPRVAARKADYRDRRRAGGTCCIRPQLAGLPDGYFGRRGTRLGHRILPIGREPSRIGLSQSGCQFGGSAVLEEEGLGQFAQGGLHRARHQHDRDRVDAVLCELDVPVDLGCRDTRRAGDGLLHERQRRLERA